MKGFKISSPSPPNYITLDYFLLDYVKQVISREKLDNSKYFKKGVYTFLSVMVDRCGKTCVTDQGRASRDSGSLVYWL
jgi:hypothetical protein